MGEKLQPAQSREKWTAAQEGGPVGSLGAKTPPRGPRFTIEMSKSGSGADSGTTQGYSRATYWDIIVNEYLYRSSTSGRGRQVRF